MEVIYAKGGRKTAVARLYLSAQEGGAMLVNGRALEDYFKDSVQRTICQKPFALLEQLGRYAVKAYVRGGGIVAQSGAVAHAAARALLQEFPDKRPILKAAGLLTRDPRMPERKKYGLRKARKRPQWTKR